MASLSFYQGGVWMDFPYDKDPRKPKIKVTHATPALVKFTLTDTCSSIANGLRRIILAEVPTLAVEIVNIEDNDSVLFDEFIAHRLGMFPLSCAGVGDIPPDDEFGYKEHKDCNCFDGCPYCQVEFKLDVTNHDDKVLNVTHFDFKDHGIQRENQKNKVQMAPFRNNTVDFDQETKDSGILVCKLKKDQRLRLFCSARKGIPKHHAKFNPVATCVMRYQPILKLNQQLASELTLDQKVELVDSCPRKVIELDNDKVVITKLNDCIYCDECNTKGKEFGKRELITATHDINMFHFTVEAVTADGPRSVIDVVRAAMRIFDYKMALFVKDAWGDDITGWLPSETTARKPTVK